MKLLKRLLWFIFIIYFGFLIKVILIKHLTLSFIAQNLELGLNHFQINLIPFAMITAYIAYGNSMMSVINVLGNVIIFIPLGVLLPILLKQFRKLPILLFISIGVSLSFETIQLLFPLLGSFDVDDLILNTFGALLGYLGFVLLRNLILSLKTRIS